MIGDEVGNNNSENQIAMAMIRMVREITRRFGNTGVTDVYMAMIWALRFMPMVYKVLCKTLQMEQIMYYNLLQHWVIRFGLYPTADGTTVKIKTDRGALAWVNNSGVAGAIDDLSDGSYNVLIIK